MDFENQEKTLQAELSAELVISGKISATRDITTEEMNYDRMMTAPLLNLRNASRAMSRSLRIAALAPSENADAITLYLTDMCRSLYLDSATLDSPSAFLIEKAPSRFPFPDWKAIATKASATYDAAAKAAENNCAIIASGKWKN